MKSLQKLTIYLTINGLILGDLKAGEIPPALGVKVRPDSIALTLPHPKESESEKYIVKFSDSNGFICHNFFREKQIKEKLFELKTQNEIIPELENKALEDKPVSMFPENALSYTLSGVVLGILTGFFISRK